MLPESASDRPLGSGQIAALLPVALLAALGSFHLGTKSLWLDEAFSAQMAILDPHQFRAVVQTLEPNMALYYLLLRGWHRLGTSDAWLRALSVVTAAAAVPPLVAVGRSLVGNAAAVYGALLFATSPFVVHHAQEARSYGLLLLLTAAATLALVRLVERASPLRWTAYVLLAVLALYTHLFAAWVLVAHAVACAWPDRARRPRRSLVAAFAAIAVLAMPLGLWLRATPRHPDWIPPLTLRRLGSSAL